MITGRPSVVGLTPYRTAPEVMSPRGRRAALEAMASERLDLLVIGGGITAAGVARDAALRGMRVGLVEQNDFAAGTSSRSTKIIHGGVRYLETFQFALVRESARERAILHDLAPHLVHRLQFLYPVFRDESLTKVRIGLRLFDFLAGARGTERSRRLDPQRTRQWLPGLREPLSGAILYPEYVTDDARLTLANVSSAAFHGALVANYAQADSFLLDGDRVVGARVQDLEAEGEMEIRARVTVNATGPWAEQLLTSGGLARPGRLVPSKGIHILLDRSRLPLRAATFLRASNGRRGLAIPRGDRVYVGTSDEIFHGDLDRVRATREEVQELVDMTCDCFPDANVGLEDVRARWAGIRPLINQKGRSTREMSRRDEVWTTVPGLVTVAGGKLTMYRPMARRVLEAVARVGDLDIPGEDRTADVPLTGAPGEGLDRFRSRTGDALARAGVSEAVRRRLAFLYGTEVETLLSYAEEDPAWLRALAPGVPALRGEVRLAVEHGMALTLPDVMDRRLALLLFEGRGGDAAAAGEAASILQKLLGWDASRRQMELARYGEICREHGPVEQ